jgi:7-carboxy-7-deazaguanine synthase
MTTATATLALPVVEVFDSLQGEGPAAGRAATFLRLGGCNLACAWCDTPYSWDGVHYDLRDEIRRRTLDELLAAPFRRLVILTGGEPLLHATNPALTYLLSHLAGRGHQVHVETNGTRAPIPALDPVTLFVVSPKLPHARADANRHDRAIQPEVLRRYADLGERAVLKVVVRDEGDCSLALALATATGFAPDRLWLMPEGTSRRVLMERWPHIASWAAAAGVNACTRLHVLAWGDTRST